MTLDLPMAVAVVGMLGVLVAVTCRLDRLSRRTRQSVRAYFMAKAAAPVIALAVLGAAPLPLDVRLAIALAVLAAAMLAGLLLSAPRWREGAPPDTTRPQEFDERGE